MPPRKRKTNLSQISSGARAVKRVRCKETPEEYALRLHKQALRQKRLRASETFEETILRRQRNAAFKASVRASQSNQHRNARLELHRARRDFNTAINESFPEDFEIVSIILKETEKTRMDEDNSERHSDEKLEKTSQISNSTTKDHFSSSHTCQNPLEEKPERNIIFPLLQNSLKDLIDPLECFLHFVDPILNQIIQFTNDEIRSKSANPETCCKEELWALIGLQLHAGTLKENHLDPREMFESPESKVLNKSTMTCDRFTFLLSSLRFDEMKTGLLEDPLSPIREILDLFNAICKNSFNPTTVTEMDEHLFPFKDEMKLVTFWDSSMKYVLSAHPQLRQKDETFSVFKKGIYERLCSSFDCSRQTEERPLAVFYTILNIAAINAYVVYCSNSLNSAEQWLYKNAFMKTVAVSLIKPWLTKCEDARELNSSEEAAISKFLTV